MDGCGLGRSEAAGRLQHDLDAQFGPGQLRRVPFGQHLDTAAVDDEGVPVHAHRAAEPPGRRVEREQPSERARFGEVVDGDDLEAAFTFEQGTQHVASDTAEPVNSDASHMSYPFDS